MEWWLWAIIVAVGLIVLMAMLGIPVAFATGILAVVGLYFAWGDKGLGVLASNSYEFSTSFVLLAVPLFMLMAAMLDYSGLGGDLFRAAEVWLGRVPGGLAVSTAAACTVMAALSGSGWANTAAIGRVAIAQMTGRGYDKGLATGVVTAGGALGILIPPSISFIIYASFANVSTARLFFAGLLPGLMAAAIMMVYIMVRCALKPSLAGNAKATQVGWRLRFTETRKTIGMVAIVILVLGSIYFGVATPTEAAALGTFLTLLLVIVQGRFTWRWLVDSCLTSAKTTGMLFLIVIAAMCLTRLLAYVKVIDGLTAAVTSLSVSPMFIVVNIMVVLLVLGMFLDPGSMLMILCPLLVPIVVALGFDPIWFGVIFVVNLEIANLTPPMGVNLFVAKAVSPPGVEMSHIMRGAIPFVFCYIVAMALVMAFPQIALWLPSRM